jgi:hypothetical protein
MGHHFMILANLLIAKFDHLKNSFVLCECIYRGTEFSRHEHTYKPHTSSKANTLRADMFDNQNQRAS